MPLKQKILDDLRAAMKNGETGKRDVLRMVDAMIKNVEIEKKKREQGLDDAEVQDVIAKSIKQRRDAVEQYNIGGRDDLVQKEQKEIDILLDYLPKQLDKEEIRKVVLETIKKTNASTKADTGKVMGLAMGQLKGKAEGKIIKEIVDEELG